MYKRAFIDEKLWAVLTENLGKLLRKEFDERSEDDRMVIERILILVRNILQVNLITSQQWTFVMYLKIFTPF
jgi:timeless